MTESHYIDVSVDRSPWLPNAIITDHVVITPDDMVRAIFNSRTAQEYFDASDLLEAGLTANVAIGDMIAGVNADE